MLTGFLQIIVVVNIRVKRETDKVEPQLGAQLLLCLGKWLTWLFNKEEEEYVGSSTFRVILMSPPLCITRFKSIRIDFVCRPELFLRFRAAAFTHTEVTLKTTSCFPSLPQLPTCRPTRLTATRCCSTNFHHFQISSSGSSSITVSTRICQTNDPPSPCSLDKYSPTLLLSLSLLIYLTVSAYRRVSAGCLEF